MNTIDAILLGGGSGSRFVSKNASELGLPKQFRMLGQYPVFIHSLNALLSLDCFRQIVLAMPKNFISKAEEQLDEFVPINQRTLIRVIAGGANRQESSYLALEALEALNPSTTRVLIHDACRAFLSQELLTRVEKCLVDRSYGAWVPVIPVVDTLKKVAGDRVIETVERGLVQRVQTPQVFEYTVIRSLSEKARNQDDISFTDDASLCEHFGIPVGVFEGDVRNIKLTYEFELQTLGSLIEGLGRRGPVCESESATTFTV